MYTAWMFFFRRIASICAAAVLMIGFCGCNSEDQRFHISGTVTFKGKPIPEGYITFEPDTTKGASGGPGMAKIINGKYDTRSADSNGTLGGPHLVRIDGFDGRTTGGGKGEVPTPNMLFSGFRTNVELPKEDTTKDFEVK